MSETIERIGVCVPKTDAASPALFHRIKVKLSRKYRVFFPLDYRGTLYDPEEFRERFKVTAECHCEN